MKKQESRHIEEQNDLLETISSEKERIFERQTLSDMLEGKTELEKAKILADHNKKKLKKGR